MQVQWRTAKTKRDFNLKVLNEVRARGNRKSNEQKNNHLITANSLNVRNASKYVCTGARSRFIRKIIGSLLCVMICT